MARYVDIENPINVRGITFIDENHDVLISLSDLRKALQILPTADVVPRAEVEELIKENESLANTVNEASELIRKLRSKDEKTKTETAPTVSKMEQVRYEVVREIFEEIERHLNPYQIQEDIYTRRAHENGDMCDYQIHQYAEHVISHTLDYFAELKKKYIGE